MRKLSPYEQTHLARFGFSSIDIAQYGEIPVEYITGKVEFGGRVLEITKDTLIPRVETEELIELAESELDLINSASNRGQVVVADVGTGCGAVGITLYWEWYHHTAEDNPAITPMTLYMSDISSSALEVARANVAKNIQRQEFVHIFQSDLLLSYPPDVKLDLIVANLPYIPTDRIKVLESSVKDFEPHVALDGGEDGLKYVRELVTQAQTRMNAEGAIVLEVDYTHDHAFMKQQLDLREFTLTMYTDSAQGTRFAVLKKK